MAKNNSKNNAKVNWGVLRDAKHADILNLIADWKNVRNQMAIDSMQKSAELSALRMEPQYKGFLHEKAWLTLDKKHQEEYNLAENAITVRYKELLKTRKAAIADIYKQIGLDGLLYDSYVVYMAVDSTEEDRDAYIREMDAFLRLGLKVPFGEKGCKYAAVELVKGIGKKLNGISAAYKSDVDAAPYKKQQFLDGVMANLRSILQERGIIAKNPIEKPKKESKPETKTEIEIENLIEEGRITLPTPVKTPDEFPEAKAEIKKPSRNRGVKSQKGNGKAKQNPKTESKKETVAA